MADQGNSSNFALSLSIVAESKGIEKLFSDIEKIKQSIAEINKPIDDIKIPSNIGLQIESLKGIAHSISEIKKKLQEFSSDEIKTISGQLTSNLYDVSKGISSVQKNNQNRALLMEVASSVNSLKEFIAGRTGYAEQPYPQIDASKLSASMDKLNNTIARANTIEHTESDLGNSLAKQVADVYFKHGKYRELSGFQKLEFALLGSNSIFNRLPSGKSGDMESAISDFLDKVLSGSRTDIKYRKGMIYPGSEKTDDEGRKIEGTGHKLTLAEIKRLMIPDIGKVLSEFVHSEEYFIREIVRAGNSLKSRVNSNKDMSTALGKAITHIGTIIENPFGKKVKSGEILSPGENFSTIDSIKSNNDKKKADAAQEFLKKTEKKYIAIFDAFLKGPEAIGNYITSGSDLHGVTDNLIGLLRRSAGSGNFEGTKELSELAKSLETNQKKFNELKKLRLDAVRAVSAAGFGGSAGELVNSYINRNGIGINTNEQNKFDQIKSIQEVAEFSKQISEFKGTSEKVISSISNLNKLQPNNSFSSYYDAMINAMTGVVNATDKMVNMLSDIRERIISTKLQKDSPVVQDEKQQKLIKRRSNNILDSILKNDKKTVAINNAYHVGEKLDFDRVGHVYFSPNSKAPTFSQLEASNAFGKQDNTEATITRIANKVAPVSRLNLSGIDPSSRDWYIEKAIESIKKDIGEGIRVLRITRDGKNYSEQVVIGKLKNLTDDPQKIKTLEEVSSRVRYNGNVDKRYFTNLLEGVKRENPEFKQRFDGFGLRKGAEANFNTETNTATFRKGASIGTRVHEYSHAVNAKLGNLLSFEEMVADMTKISFGGKSNYSEILNEVAKSITFGKNPIENAKKLAEKMVQLSDMFEYINQEISAVKGKKYVKGNILNIAMSIDSLFHNMELAAGGDKKQIAGIRESKGKLLEKLLFSNYGGAKERSRRIAQYDNIVDKLVESGKFDISSYDDLRKISGIAIDSVFMSNRMRPSSDYRNNGIYEDKSEEVKERRKKHSAEKEKIKKQEEERMIQHGAEIFDINDVVWLENAFSPNYLMPQYDIMRKYRLAQKVRETGRPEGDFKTQAQANEFLDSLNRSGSVAYKVPVYKGSEIEIDDKGRIANQKMNGMYTRFFTTRSKLDEDYLVRGKKDIDDFTYFRRMLSAAMTYKPTEEMMKNLNAPSRRGAYAGMDENLAVIKSILNQSGYKFNRKEDFEQVVKKLFVGQGVNSENARKIGEIIADVLRTELKRSKTEQSIISPSSPDDIRKQKKQLERERVNAIKEDIASRAESKSMTAAGNVINKVAMYGTVTSVFYGVAHGIQNAINTMKNFETQLVETTKVLNPVYEGTTKISEAAQDFGVKYGTSIVNVAGAMSTFAQQGKSVSETINLTEASLLAANTTTLKAAEATEALTAAMKQFNIADKDAKSIIDSWLEVESRTAVTARTMALALRQTGTVARSAGVSFHELNGIISAVGSATRESGNAIGTALKYIFSHMNTDDVIEKFSQLGIAVYDSDGKMRGLMDRLSSLNEKWKGMTSEQRTATAIAIAGTRRYNSLMILMDKWGDVIDATKMSEDSYGRAMTANTRVMGTYAKQIEKTKATMENFFATTFESGGKGLLNYFESLKQTIASIGAVIPDSLATMIGSASVLGLGSMMISRTFAYSGIGNYLQGIDRRKSDEKAFSRQYREIMSPVYGGRSETLGSFFNLFNPRRLTEERIKRAEANLREFRLERVDDPLHPGAKKFDFAKGTKGEEWANKQRARGIAEERLITLTQQHNLERQRELDILKKSTGSLRGFNGRLDVLGMHIQKHAAVIGMLGIGMMSIANSKLFEDKYSSTGKNIAGQSMDFAGAILSGAAAGSMFGPKGAIAGAALAGVTKTIEYAPKWYEDLFGSTEKENARLLKESNRIKNLDSGIKEYRRLLERRNRGELLSPEEETRFRETQNIVMMTDPNSVEIDRLTGRARLSDEYARNYKYSSGSDRRRLFNQMAYNTMFGGGGTFGNSSQDVFDSAIRKQAQVVQKALYDVNNSTGTAQERNKDVYRKELEQLDTLQKQREKSFEPFIMSYGNMAKDITNYVRQGGSGESPFSNLGKEYSGKMYEQFVKVFGEREAREKILSSYIGGRTAGRTYDWSPDVKNRAYATGKITELIRVKNNEDGSSVYQLVETDFATQQQRVVKTFTVKRGTTSFAAIQEAIKGTDLKSSEVFHIDSATQEYFDLPLKTIDKFIDTLNKISDSTQKRLQRSLRYAEEDYRLVNSSTIFDPSSLSKITAFRKSVSSRKGLFGDISSYIEEMNRIESLPEGSKRVTSRTTLQAQISAGELAGTASAAFLTSINKIATYSEKLNTISKLVSMDFGSSNKGGTNLEADASTSQNYAIKQINEFLKTKGMNTTFEQMVADSGGGEKGREKARQLVLNMMAQDANEGVEDAFKALEDTANAVFEFYGKLRENSENTEKAIKDRTSVIMALNKDMSFYDAEAIARKELEGNFNVPEQFGQEIKQLSSFIDLLEQQLKTNKQNVQGSEQELEKLKTQLKEAESVGDKNSADKFRQQIQGITDALAKQRQNNVTIENRIASLRKGRDAREQAIFGEEVRKGLFSDAVSLRKFRDQLQIRRASEGINATENMWGGSQRLRIEQAQEEMDRITNLSIGRLKEQGYNFGSYEDIQNRFKELQEKEQQGILSDAEKKEYAQIREVINAFSKDFNNAATTIANNQKSIEIAVGKQGKQIRSNYANFEFYALTGHRGTAQAQATLTKSLYDNITRAGVEFFRSGKEKLSANDRDKAVGMFQDLNNLQDMIDRESNLSYRKNYLLASNQERAMIDMIDARRQMGESMEGIFADPFMKEYAKKHSAVGQAIDYGLQKEPSLRMLDLQGAQTDVIKRLFNFMTSKASEGGFKVTFNDGQLSNLINTVIRESKSLNDEAKNTVSGSIGTTGAAGRRRGAAGGFVGYTGNGGKYEPKGVLDNIVYHSDEIISILKSGGNKEDRDYIARLSMDYNSGKRLKHAANGIVISSGSSGGSSSSGASSNQSSVDTNILKSIERNTKASASSGERTANNTGRPSNKTQGNIYSGMGNNIFSRMMNGESFSSALNNSYGDIFKNVQSSSVSASARAMRDARNRTITTRTFEGVPQYYNVSGHMVPYSAQKMGAEEFRQYYFDHMVKADANGNKTFNPKDFKSKWLEYKGNPEIVSVPQLAKTSYSVDGRTFSNRRELNSYVRSVGEDTYNREFYGRVNQTAPSISQTKTNVRREFLDDAVRRGLNRRSVFDIMRDKGISASGNVSNNVFTRAAQRTYLDQLRSRKNSGLFTGHTFDSRDVMSRYMRRYGDASHQFVNPSISFVKGGINKGIGNVRDFANSTLSSAMRMNMLKTAIHGGFETFDRMQDGDTFGATSSGLLTIGSAYNAGFRFGDKSLLGRNANRFGASAFGFSGLLDMYSGYKTGNNDRIASGANTVANAALYSRKAQDFLSKPLAKSTVNRVGLTPSQMTSYGKGMSWALAAQLAGAGINYTANNYMEDGSVKDRVTALGDLLTNGGAAAGDLYLTASTGGINKVIEGSIEAGRMTFDKKYRDDYVNSRMHGISGTNSSAEAFATMAYEKIANFSGASSVLKGYGSYWDYIFGGRSGRNNTDITAILNDINYNYAKSAHVDASYEDVANRRTTAFGKLLGNRSISFEDNKGNTLSADIKLGKNASRAERMQSAALAFAYLKKNSGGQVGSTNFSFKTLDPSQAAYEAFFRNEDASQMMSRYDFRKKNQEAREAANILPKIKKEYERYQRVIAGGADQKKYADIYRRRDWLLKQIKRYESAGTFDVRQQEANTRQAAQEFFDKGFGRKVNLFDKGGILEQLRTARRDNDVKQEEANIESEQELLKQAREKYFSENKRFYSVGSVDELSGEELEQFNRGAANYKFKGRTISELSSSINNRKNRVKQLKSQKITAEGKITQDDFNDLVKFYTENPEIVEKSQNNAIAETKDKLKNARRALDIMKKQGAGNDAIKKQQGVVDGLKKKLKDQQTTLLHSRAARDSSKQIVAAKNAQQDLDLFIKRRDAARKALGDADTVLKLADGKSVTIKVDGKDVEIKDFKTLQEMADNNGEKEKTLRTNVKKATDDANLAFNRNVARQELIEENGGDASKVTEEMIDERMKRKQQQQGSSSTKSSTKSGPKSKGAKGKAKADSSGETFELWGSVDGSLGKVVSKTKTLTKEQADRYLQDKDRFTVVTVNGKKIVTRKSNQAAVEALHKNKDVGKAVRDQFTAIGKTAEAKNKATQDFLKSEDGEFLDSAIDEMSADELAKKGFSKKNLDARRSKILEQRRMKALEAKAKELKMSVPELERKIKRGEIADVEYNEEISNSELLSEAERFHLASDEGVRNKAKKQHAESAKQQAQQQAEFDAMEAEAQEIENADIERQTSLFNRQYRNADGSLINSARVREIQTGRVKPQNKAEEDIAREAVSEYGYVHKPGEDNYLRKYAVQGGYIEPETDEDKEWLAEKQEEDSRKSEAERTRKQNTPEGNTSSTTNNNSSTDDSKLLDGIEKIDPNSGMAMIRTVLTGQILPVLQQTLNAAQNNEGQQREQRSVFGTKIPDGNQ